MADFAFLHPFIRTFVEARLGGITPRGYTDYDHLSPHWLYEGVKTDLHLVLAVKPFLVIFHLD